MKNLSNLFTLLLFTIFISSLINLNASIEGARPEYDYREFIMEDIPLDFFVPQVSPQKEHPYLFGWQQGYYLNHYHYSVADYQDSSILVNLSGLYKETLNQSSFSLDYKNKHRFDFRYYNWDHKENLGLGDIISKNSFKLYSSNDLNLLWRNSIRYLFQHQKSPEYMEEEINTLELSGDFLWHFSHSGWSFSYNLPYQHQWERWQIASALYKTGDNYLLGGGVSFIKDNSSYIFPYLVARYNYSNHLILRLFLEEDLVSYPFSAYFTNNRLLWRSSLPITQSNLQPYRLKKSVIGVDYFSTGFLQKLVLEYGTSEKFYDFVWFNDFTPEYSIALSENSREYYLLSYSLSYKASQLHLDYRPGGRIDFEPLLLIRGSQKFTLSLFHDILISAGYHLRESIKIHSGDNLQMVTGDYLSALFSYRYTKFKNIDLESGIAYSFQNQNKFYMDLKPDIYLKITYGRNNNESLY